MTVCRALLPASLLACVLAACGGNGNGGNGNGDGDGTPPPGSGTPNPCSTVQVEAGPVVAATSPEAIQRKRGALDHNPRWRVLDALWAHRQRAARRGPRAAVTTGRDAVDVGEIAVLQDQGDLIIPPNQFDLRGAGLRFAPNADGGYSVSRIDGAFRMTLGTRLALEDDDSEPLNVPFPFPFYGSAQTLAFVNSDGNVTFEEEDRASTERSVARVLTGPPRVAPFFADLDPSTGGRIFAHAAADQYTVTWCGVRGFDSVQATTVQVTLLPDGAIEIKFGDAVTLLDAIVAVSPGRTGEFQAVNLSDQTVPGGRGALGERFAESAGLDTVEISRAFYRSHGDDYDQLIIWTDARLLDDAFAYETTVANGIRGLGIQEFDASEDFGSARLESFAVMDFVGKYPDNPQARVLGENSTLAVLAHETGHRWLAFFEFRDHNGSRSEALLGRDSSHWSFFFDSDASVMEGNDIEDLGGGSFRTVAAAERYSLLDQYAMGLVPASQVPPFFYVEAPANVSPPREAEDGPDVGVTFNGTRRDVLIQDVIAVHGDRSPSAAQSPRVHRQAYVFVIGSGRTPDSAHIAKIDRIRREFEPFFLQATEGRMRVETELR